MEQCRTAAEQARNAALKAERDARDATRAGDAASSALERIEAQRAGLSQRQADLEPVLDAAQAAVTAAEQALGALPDPAALEHEVKGRAGGPLQCGVAVADKRAEAATKARETAADRERLNAASREQGDWHKRQADAEKRPGRRARKAGPASRRSAQSSKRNRRSWMVRSLRWNVPTAKARSRSVKPHPPSAPRRKLSSRPLARCPRPTKGWLTRASGGRRRRRAPRLSRRARPNLRATSVDRFECVPQRLPEKLGFDPDEIRDPDAEVADARAADRGARADRTGQFGRRAGTGRARRVPDQGRRGGRGADPGDQPPARLDRQSQPRRPGAAAGSL